jgi:hypothetical protein
MCARDFAEVNSRETLLHMLVSHSLWGKTKLVRVQSEFRAHQSALCFVCSWNSPDADSRAGNLKANSKTMCRPLHFWIERIQRHSLDKMLYVHV